MTSSNHHIMLFIYNTYSSVYRELLVSEAGKSSIKSKENSVDGYPSRSCSYDQYRANTIFYTYYITQHAGYLGPVKKKSNSKVICIVAWVVT